MTGPRVVIITDRTLLPSVEIAKRIAAILAGVARGAVAIQIREKDLDGGPLLRLAREILEVAQPAGAPVWINDRVDVALAAGADGAHLPETGLAIADARALAPALAIGVSRHDEAGALAAAAADVIQLGPIFATPGKTVVGTALLGVRAHLPASVCVVAVGGIDSPARAREARAAGADAVALMRAVWQAPDPVAVVRGLIDALA